MTTNKKLRNDLKAPPLPLFAPVIPMDPETGETLSNESPGEMARALTLGSPVDYRDAEALIEAHTQWEAIRKVAATNKALLTDMIARHAPTEGTSRTKRVPLPEGRSIKLVLPRAKTFDGKKLLAAWEALSTEATIAWRDKLLSIKSVAVNLKEWDKIRDSTTSPDEAFKMVQSLIKGAEKETGESPKITLES